HSRMYGVRSMADLAVTRFYAPQNVYQIMRNIHAFDAALREAFESGAHDQGVYFIQVDAQNRLIPCSPNKLMFSNVVSIRPGRRLLPIGFSTVSKTAGSTKLEAVDKRIEQLEKGKSGQPVLIAAEDAVDLLEMAYANLEFTDDSLDEHNAHAAALEHLSRMSADPKLRGKVWLLTVVDRNVA